MALYWVGGVALCRQGATELCDRKLTLAISRTHHCSPTAHSICQDGRLSLCTAPLHVHSFGSQSNAVCPAPHPALCARPALQQSTTICDCPEIADTILPSLNGRITVDWAQLPCTDRMLLAWPLSEPASVSSREGVSAFLTISLSHTMSQRMSLAFSLSNGTNLVFDAVPTPAPPHSPNSTSSRSTAVTTVVDDSSLGLAGLSKELVRSKLAEAEAHRRLRVAAR